MRNNKKLFLLMVLLMGIVTNFSLSINTISAFAENNRKTEAEQEQDINTLESTSPSQENQMEHLSEKIIGNSIKNLDIRTNEEFFTSKTDNNTSERTIKKRITTLEDNNTGEKRKNKLFYIGMIIIIFTITNYNLRKNKHSEK
ncbi:MULTISPECIES: hypothetical protein [Vagococcus]|uniref:Uncharacterized protein n=1 Tax=Vagococcus fluvialis bH819 TaxID=1255619 RepID=A0A1X6WNF6_9ENTE|nr:MULTISPECIES: hypothetical protein [Vagococcus]SLM85762.1 hypothetical protein FM121_06655 [Vagococcus fluvialis bH819]HCM90184.1 hypothetical protein [Vagococcus sp.]